MKNIYIWNIYNGILFSHKKNEILPFVTTWIDLEDIMLSQTSHTKKNKWCIISLICGNKKKWTNTMKQKQFYRYREEIGGYQSGMRG